MTMLSILRVLRSAVSLLLLAIATGGFFQTGKCRCCFSDPLISNSMPVKATLSQVTAQITLLLRPNKYIFVNFLA